MDTIDVHDAKARLTRLVKKAAAGAEIVIARNGIPRAKLVRIDRRRRVKLGVLKGKIRYPDDFDAPLPPKVLDDSPRLRPGARFLG